MKTCGVRVYEAKARKGCACEHGCDHCLIGCFNPVRHRNPFFGTKFWSDAYWWRGMYASIEYLCAECYDDMVEHEKETEEVYRGFGGNYVENPEYTKFLETL